MHRKDMSMMREESRLARRERKKSSREQDRAFDELRARLNSEMPSSDGFSKFRGAVAFMLTLFGVLTY